MDTANPPGAKIPDPILLRSKWLGVTPGSKDKCRKRLSPHRRNEPAELNQTAARADRGRFPKDAGSQWPRQSPRHRPDRRLNRTFPRRAHNRETTQTGPPATRSPTAAVEPPRQSKPPAPARTPRCPVRQMELEPPPCPALRPGSSPTQTPTARARGRDRCVAPPKARRP